MNRRITLFGALLTLCFAVFIGRLVYVQIIAHGDYAKRAKAQQTARLELPAKRGSIFDTRGRLLAVSLDRESVFVDPPLVPNKLGTAEKLSASLSMDPNAVLASLLKKGTNFVWLRRRLTQEESSSTLSLGITGLGSIVEEERTHPEGLVAAHVLGIVGDDGVGLEGIERGFDKYLAGKTGFAMVRVDGKRRRIISPDAEIYPPVPGYHVVLTVDAGIQKILEEELDAVMEKWKAASASGVIIAPFTGDVLAIANRPTYSPDDFRTCLRDDVRNRAVTDCFEPGSVLKPFIASAALQEGTMGLDNRIYCENGAWAVKGRTLHDHKPFGELSFSDVIIHSSNVGAAKIAMSLGKKRAYSYLSAFGFGERTGIALEGETSGILRPLRDWSDMTVMSSAIGHEIAVSPLQLARAYCTIANGGVLMKPRIVKKVVATDGEVIEEFPNRNAVRRVLRPEVALTIRGIMTKVVESGTGTRAQVEGFDVGGKTGTAQKINPDGTYSHSDYVASFVGFAPASSPLLCVAIVVDEPRGAYYGGTVAAPAVGNVIRRSLAYMGIEPKNEQTASVREMQDAGG